MRGAIPSSKTKLAWNKYRRVSGGNKERVISIINMQYGTCAAHAMVYRGPLTLLRLTE